MKSAQLVNLNNYVTEGDMLLIGKNALNVSFYLGGVQKQIAAREFMAYHFVKEWDSFPAVAPDGEGWRASMNTFKDSSTTTVVKVVSP